MQASLRSLSALLLVCAMTTLATSTRGQPSPEPTPREPVQEASAGQVRRVSADRIQAPSLDAPFQCERQARPGASGDTTAYVSCIARGAGALTQLMAKEYTVRDEFVRTPDDIATNTYIPQWTGILRGARVESGWVEVRGQRVYELVVRGQHADHGHLVIRERVTTRGRHVFVWTHMTNRPANPVVRAAAERWFEEVRFDNLTAS